MIVNKYNKGGGGSPFDPTQYYTKSQVDAEISGATEGLASEEYVDEAISGLTDMIETKEEVIASALTELNETFDDYYTMDEVDEVIEEALSGVSFDGYWTSGETKSYVDNAASAITSQVEDVERVTATALTELHQDILVLSGATSGYATEEYVDAAITAGTQGFITSAYTGFTSTQDFDAFVDSIEVKEGVIASALTELNETKVESEDIHYMVALSQADYDALVSGGTVDSQTFYIITGSTSN